MLFRSLNGKANLEKRFAEIDSTIVREELMKREQASQKIAPEILKLIKTPQFPKAFVALFME